MIFRCIILDPDPICPEGWIPNAGTNECYYFDDNQMDYASARAYCADKSSLSNVIVVRNEQEQSFLNRECVRIKSGGIG